jgi:hypothetical protein
MLGGELEQDRYLNYLKLRSEAQSWEEVLQVRKQKDKHLGKLLYHYRREVSMNDRNDFICLHCGALSLQRHGAQGIATTVPTVFTAAMLICIAVTGLACAGE